MIKVRQARTMTTDMHDTEAQRDTYPVWTVRYTWAVLGSDDKPKRTHDGPARGENDAIDRAVFTLDHYQSDGANVLVCAEVKRPDGRWHDVPRSNVNLTIPAVQRRASHLR